MTDMLMQVGRVVYLNFGPCSGKLAVVVDLVDENRILVDGPTTGVDRQVVPAKRLTLTKFRIKSVLRNQHQKTLVKNITAFDLEKKWATTAMAKKLDQRQKRANLTDFQRFQALVLRRQLSKTLRTWVNKNKTRVLKK